MKASRIAVVYRQWFRDRLRSTVSWTAGLVMIIVATAAFYPSLKDLMAGLGGGDSGLSSIMGLEPGLDPSSPLGFLWTNLYANIVPWILMALGIGLGTAAIAGDEGAGTLEYLLSKPITRAEVVVARFAGMVTILFVVAAASGLALMAIAPFVELTTDSSTGPGMTFQNVVDGTFAAAAVGLGIGSIAFLIGGATGRKPLATGVSTGIAVAGYVLYTLANVTGSVEFLTWLSPWRWYVADAMFVDGLTWNVALPFGLAIVCFGATLQRFVHRDLQS